MDIIGQLEASRDKTLKYFDLSEVQLSRTYGPGKWPVRFVLHHIADSETVLNERIRRTISEPRQVLWVFNQEDWARGLDYARMPLELSRDNFRAVRAGIIYLAREHYEKNGHLEYVHSETGVRTLKMEFEKVAWHNEQHLAQIEKAIS
jgi:hypothetical protein